MMYISALIFVMIAIVIGLFTAFSVIIKSDNESYRVGAVLGIVFIVACLVVIRPSVEVRRGCIMADPAPEVCAPYIDTQHIEE